MLQPSMPSPFPTKIDTPSIQAALDSKTKPPGSLGRLETLAAQLGAIQNTLTPCMDRQRICIFAGSHGITDEGVSAYPASVTAQMVLNFLSGGAAINVLTRAQGIGLRVIDCGVDDRESPLPVAHEGLRRAPVCQNGTISFLRACAMTNEECRTAMTIGASEVTAAVADGIELLGLGEMGIGNTTSASALAALLTGISSDKLVGRGTGVSDEGLARKREIVAQALGFHATVTEPVARLAAVGGFEIAAMTGAVLEAYAQKLPVVIDGFISTAAVVAAHALEPRVLEVCIFSHCSAESGHRHLLSFLQVEAVLDLGLRLGEGSGAALAMPIIKSAARILSEMATFTSANVTEKSI
jgi:nicotinate-nucleotide--dimethylbenzimidazole phosphoribosyltransferase